VATIAELHTAALAALEAARAAVVALDAALVADPRDADGSGPTAEGALATGRMLVAFDVMVAPRAALAVAMGAL
jgi:hypothetical protein